MAEPDGARVERLAAIWRELLGTATVGPDDDLFELGGHSIFVLRLLDRIAGEFAVAVTVADVLECRTVSALAQRIGELHAVRPAR
jgi:acyl carrier protein